MEHYLSETEIKRKTKEKVVSQETRRKMGKIVIYVETKEKFEFSKDK
jgi:hypothetical protein